MKITSQKLLIFCMFCLITVILSAGSLSARTRYRRLPISVYRDKMIGGWLGQMAGVTQGAVTEFRYGDKIIPESEMPDWSPKLINDAYWQDDLYVEMTFLHSMEQYGLDVPIRQAGLDFANSIYGLACANNAGRRNLRKGIAPPDSGHPQFNKCPNDIDYQIESDYSGLIGPGMPNVAIRMGDKFGHLMNYGDGVYAGQFMGGMYSAAFFEKDIRKVVEAGLKCIPEECQYAQMVRDMLKWSRQNADWEKTWQLCEDKYRKDPEFQKASNGGIDCKINGAYVLMGLLYGKGDPDKTIKIACRCGQDSDCNPSSSAGVLFAITGYSKIPDQYKKELIRNKEFNFTTYDFDTLIQVCEKLAKQTVIQEGGRIETNKNGEEILVIPIKPANPSPLELSWAPAPAVNSKFTEAEMDQISAIKCPESAKQGIKIFAPEWEMIQCGPDMNPGLRDIERGRKNIMVTHPQDQETPCILKRTVNIPSDKKTTLKLTVTNHPGGDWDLIVMANDRELLRKAITRDLTNNDWIDINVDLSGYAGQTVKLSLLNQPSDWFCEAGYWARIAIESE